MHDPVMTGPGVALPVGVDPAARSRELAVAHDEFLATGQAHPPVRPLVADSWRRCLAQGMDPEHSMAPVHFTDDSLAAIRDAHPLAAVMPVIRRLLVEDAIDDGLLVAVSDAAGRLLWVEGEHRLRSQAASMHFVEGASWGEADAGTNAPGTALALDHAVQIFAAEHLSRLATSWSCSAAPIHDPDTGAVLGALDLTGGDEIAAPRALTLVRATVAAVESELRLQRLGAQSAPGATAYGLRLDLLGLHGGVLHNPAGLTRLSLRHSELLLLLATAVDGLSAEELAVALHEHEVPPVTVRAELSRLRPLLGEVALLSRPYRLVGPIQTDIDGVRRCLAAGSYTRAIDLYRGPLLPASQAPGVVELRRDLHSDVRAALLAARDPDALLRLADTQHGRLDVELWQTALAWLPPGSPRHAQVRAHVDRLAIELR
jgi:hypothetical protein